MDRTGTTSRKDCVGASKSFQERREALFQPRDFALLGNCQAICLPYDGGPADDPRHLMNFCPEVLYERFGLFATALHGYADEIDIDSAHSQLAAEHAPASDWGWTWASVNPMHYTDCPLYSPLMQNGPNQLGLLNMCTEQNGRDPFRVVVGVIDDSDVLVTAALARQARALARGQKSWDGTKRDYPGQNPGVCCGFGEAPRPDGDQDFCPAVSPHSAILEEGWTVLTPGKACLKGLAALTTNTTQATIQAQMKPSSSWWRCSEPSRSASSAVGAVFANVQTPRCSRSSDGWWPLGVREQI